MASFLRSLFGGHSSRSSSRERTQSHSKSHSHSRSVPPAVNAVPYAYTASSAVSVHGSVPSVPSSSTRSHSPTTSRMRPSPLRYNTYDSSTISSKTRPTKPLQLPSGTISYKSGDAFVPYPIYTPALSTYSSSRTNSNSSIYPPSTVSGHGHHHSSSYSGRPSSAPRTSSSSGSVASRPALKQTHTWHGGVKSETGPRPHVSFVNPRRPITLHMHPLFAASHRSRAPISYDVTYPPTSKTVVDRTTRTSVPAHTLSQPATDPPTLSKLVLRSDKFPWPIVVQAKCSTAPTLPPQPKSPAKFYLGGSSPTASADAVTNMDVLFALHHTLTHRVTKEEWDALGQGSRAQRKVSRAYERRCKALGGGWEGGIRRIDWLGEKTRLIGVEVDKGASETGVGKLIFGRP